MKWVKRVVKLFCAVLVLAVCSLLFVSLVTRDRTIHIMTVSRETSASAESVWDLWADVDRRPEWDGGLDWITIDGEFETGQTGEVKLEGQPARKYEILAAEPHRLYTDRFFLPMGNEMDWEHTISDRGDTRVVTFDISAHGPTTFLLAPIMKSILNEELPPTVDELVQLAEKNQHPPE